MKTGRKILVIGCLMAILFMGLVISLKPSKDYMEKLEKSKSIRMGDSYSIVIQIMGKPINSKVWTEYNEIELDYGTAPMASGPLNVIVNAKDSTVIRVGPEI